MLPPTSDSLLQHMKRAIYQAYIWRHSLDAMQDLNSPEGHGWEKEEGVLKPVLMTKEPAPKSLLELTTCQYKKSECRTNCSCNNAGLSCTESCVCVEDERCQRCHMVYHYTAVTVTVTVMMFKSIKLTTHLFVTFISTLWINVRKEK